MSLFTIINKWVYVPVSDLNMCLFLYFKWVDLSVVVNSVYVPFYHKNSALMLADLDKC